MRIVVKFVLNFLIGLGVALALNTQTEMLFAQSLKKNDRIVFLGDSITQGGDGHDKGYVRIVRKVVEEKFPGIEVIGAGISGNKVPDLQRRLDKDVIDKNPTIVVIYIGINDVWHSRSGRGTNKEDFRSGLEDVIGRVHDAGAKAILCTASVIGEKTDGTNSLDEMLDEYCNISRNVAADLNVQMIDLRKAFLSYLKEKNPENKEKKILTTDGVHLNEAGNRFVAHEMLQGLMKNQTHARNEKVLRHVVLFKFNDDVSDADVASIVEAFGKLKSKIDAIIDYEFGTNVSVENLSQGFTHCFVVTFKDEAGRDAYLPHPAHKEFVALLKDKLDKVLVVDFWATGVD